MGYPRFQRFRFRNNSYPKDWVVNTGDGNPRRPVCVSLEMNGTKVHSLEVEWEYRHPRIPNIFNSFTMKDADYVMGIPSLIPFLCMMNGNPLLVSFEKITDRILGVGPRKMREVISEYIDDIYLYRLDQL